MAIDDKIKAVARDEAQRVQALASEGFRSGSWLYPFRGMIFFLAHKSLRRPFFEKLLPTVTLGVGITVAMFVLTYIPQTAVLALFEGPVAPLSGALLVLSQSSTLFNVISKGFVIGDGLTDTFDGTLVARDCESLVGQGRELKRGSDAMGRLGKLVKRPFERLSPTALLRYFMYLPLNFIPVVGTILFITLQGKRFGPNSHARYFQLKSYSSKQREEFVESHRGAYTGFGIVATVLELIPVASIFFSFTNACGAALWAADLEKRSGTTAPGLREKAARAQ